MAKRAIRKVRGFWTKNASAFLARGLVDVVYLCHRSQFSEPLFLRTRLSMEEGRTVDRPRDRNWFLSWAREETS